MKKRNPFVTAILFIVVVSTACHYHRYRTRTVSVSNDHSSLKIEYCGDIIFNNNETAIEEMAPGGYVKYRKDDDRFVAECNDQGHISYKVTEADTRLNISDPRAKEFVARTIREIAGHYNR
jgi:hypothetical protein